jgi:hypothetical protein
MGSPDSRDPARRLLALARTDRRAADRAMAELSLDAQVELLCDAPIALRGALLDLAPEPELLIPRLPEAELCFTAKAVGLGDAETLLAYATPEQIVACVDLDAFRGDLPDLPAFTAWMECFAGAGEETLLRSIHAIDPEMLVLWLREQVEVVAKPNEEGWEPPVGAVTLEGQFYLCARRTDDDLAPLLEALHLLFQKDYWLYFRLLQGTQWELESDTQEFAARWRTGRLQDLGFPPREEALAIYAHLRPEARAAVPDAARALERGERELPARLPRLPAELERRHSVFRAVEQLGEEERRVFFGAFVSLANAVAVADSMPLGDPESIPAAIEKAAALTSRGLDFVATERTLDPTAVLRRLPLDHLFRVGANLERER